MNGSIFKVFGVAILLFDLLLVLLFSLAILRLIRGGDLVEGLVVFFGFLIISAVIAAGLICLQRWAAITASAIGLVWSLTVAALLGYAPWESLLVGGPTVFGLLTPLYATIRHWSSLQSVGDVGLTPFVDALRSSDRLHLR